ncbi:sugar kinase [Leeuwenhoekiella sp. MAR_2009_132]|uniref:sugar kinase n=1 Tax=Leeuwenhoekiella sp. MAR_2009_132 TaxID=1392489 RepID=UPI000490D7B3|nr:sugar kinase [Leeuwenhoekiella sp. MAR_2009_132]
MKRVVTFGELMMRLATQHNERFGQARSLGVTYGGGEFNVAVSLSNYGMHTQFVSRFPDNDLGKSALEEVNRFKVNSDYSVIGGERLGVYFLEQGAGLRPSSVVYDRANSSLATATPGTFDWDAIFENATWFHWSGVTPGLSQNAADVTLEALKVAKSKGVNVSCDLNYRSKLWKYGKAPSKVMPQLLAYSKVILGDIDTAYFMMGQDRINPDYTKTDILPNLYHPLFKACPDLEYIATSLRKSINTSHQRIGGILCTKEQLLTANNYDVNYVVDRVGSGDAFMAGLIYGLNELPLQQAIEFATAACVLKHTIPGDLNRACVAEVEQLIAGGGDVQR